MSDEFASLTAQTPADWDRWLSRNTRQTLEGVTLAKTPAISETSLGFAATDIDLNPNGNLAVLTDAGEVRIYVADDQTVKPLSLTGYDDVGFELPELIGTTGELLYVIDGEAGQIGAFSRRLRRLEWTSEDVVVNPVSAVGTGQRLYVLDHGSGLGDGFVRTLDDEGTSVVFENLQSPLDLTVDADETLSVLDERDDGPVLLRSTADVGLFVDDLSVVPLALPDGFTPTAVAAQTTSLLVFYGTDVDDEPTLIRYDIDQETVTARSTLDGSWTGLVSGTVEDSGNSRCVYLRSSADGDVWAFEQDQENRKDPENTRYEGRLIGRFDSGQRDTTWHRATLDVEQNGPGNRIDIQYYASECETEGIDDLTALPERTPAQQDDLTAAGVEGLWDLIQYTPDALANVVSDLTVQQATNWLEIAHETLEPEFENQGTEVTDPTDTLLTEATGRYLHVLIRFVGSRQRSPRLNSLRVHCPHQSYLRYLPEIYQNVGRSSTFLKRFLSIFETTFVDIEDNLADITRYLDPQEIPTDYLSWLNGWLALELGDTWPEDARRELLERAPDLYRQRGTKQGLLSLIDLYLDHVTLPEPPWSRSLVRIDRQLDSLVDRGFLTRPEADAKLTQYRETANLGHADEVIILEYDELACISDPDIQQRYHELFGHPRRFQILLQPTMPDKHVSAIQEIANSEKPLYTDVRAEKLQRRFQINANTYLGINTYLPNRQFEIGQSALGTQTTIEEQTIQQ